MESIKLQRLLRPYRRLLALMNNSSTVKKIPNDIANVDPRSPDILRPVTLQKSAMILLIEPDSFSTPEAQILPYAVSPTPFQATRQLLQSSSDVDCEGFDHPPCCKKTWRSKASCALSARNLDIDQGVAEKESMHWGCEPKRLVIP